MNDPESKDVHDYHPPSTVERRRWISGEAPHPWKHRALCQPSTAKTTPDDSRFFAPRSRANTVHRGYRGR